MMDTSKFDDDMMLGQNPTIEIKHCDLHDTVKFWIKQYTDTDEPALQVTHLDWEEGRLAPYMGASELIIYAVDEYGTHFVIQIETSSEDINLALYSYYQMGKAKLTGLTKLWTLHYKDDPDFKINIDLDNKIAPSLNLTRMCGTL